MKPRRRRSLVGTGLAAVLPLLLLAGASGPATARIPAESDTSRRDRAPVSPCPAPVRRAGDLLGFSPGSVYRRLSDRQLGAELATTVQLRVRWIRLDLDWSVIQPAPDRWDWAATDRMVQQAHAAGLRVLGLLTYAPSWARARGLDSHAPPTDPQQFAAFAATAAERYGAAVSAWEVWNEPNLARFWGPRADPERYATLLRLTAAALRARHLGPVVSGGLAPAVDEAGDLAPTGYLDRLYAAGARGSLDAVGVHPYSYPLLPGDPAPWNTFGRLDDLRATAVRHGDSALPFWLTEFGAPTGRAPGAVTPGRQALILREALAWTASRSWVGPVFVYSLRDAGDDPADREQNFGVEDAAGVPKPAWSVLALATGALTPCRAARPTPGPGSPRPRPSIRASR